ncbi:MAG: UDP-4-amino-4,6-dideoxy-N-acetyl-beta-L-altrosamine transaminase [Clostridia bacterium]|nr:UDP-4-amino-4,6-dideoxy-N-acetyl-beta-L-altrosamine transaminase [Clostridia bacterium]
MKQGIPYGRQYIDEEDIKSIIEVLKGDYLTTGPYVKKFEENFAHYVGVKYAVAVANGTAALHLACLAAGIGAGDEVITSPITFAASANCALYVGAKPVFADIDSQTYNIDPSQIKTKISAKTKAIIPVHYTGLPCDMKAINEIAKEKNLMVIEDACHALGARYKNTKIGDCTYSDMTVFSFHPVKHITTGEGGMITTNSKELYQKLLLLRSHGITRDEDQLKENHGGWYYEMQTLGYNYRLTDIQSALGISQLKKVDWFIQRRREIAEMYNRGLKDLPLELPFEPEGCINSYHLYVIRLKKEAKVNRKELYDYLKSKGIYSQVHYIPVHTLPYYREKLGYNWGDYPKAEEHYRNVLTLPIYPGMTDEDVKFVISKLKEVLK